MRRPWARRQPTPVTSAGLGWRASAAGIAIALSLVVPAAAVTAAALDEDPGDNLSVDVIDDTEATPSPGPSPSAGVGGTGGWGGGGGEPSPTPASSPTPTPDAEGDSGLVQLGGLRAYGVPSWNPFASTVHVRVTVRNGLGSAFDATAAFELQTMTGQRIGAIVTERLRDLKPGETREVEVVLPGAGQWTLMRVVATVTPPRSVDGVELPALQRETWVIVFPWLVLVVLVIAAAAGVILWLLRGGPRRAP